MNDRATASESERAICTPCRGSGSVISSLGGTPHQVTCPWCEGSGKFIPGRDAQASRAENPDDR